MQIYCQHCLAQMNTQLDYTRICGKCLGKPKFYRACAPLRFEDATRRLIHQFKYQERPGLSLTLALLMVEEVIRRNMPEPQLLIPMPLHPLRLSKRGYNQSALLCHELSRLLNIPWSARSLTRIHNTPPLTGLELQQRKKQLRGAMRAQIPKGITEIALIDDVLTTGSSAQEGVRAIKAVNRQASIQIWTLAHRV